MRDELRKILAETEHSSTDRQAELAGELEEAKVTVLARLMRPTPSSFSQQPDRLIDVKEAAERLGKTENWIYHHHKQLPFTRQDKKGGPLGFSSAGLDAYIRNGRGYLTARQQKPRISPVVNHTTEGIH